jgi:hypothetical protein
MSGKEWPMQSTNIRQIKAALVDQAFHGTTQVRCSLGRVVAVSRWSGQLRVMIRGWGRWYPVESVSIEGDGSQLLQEHVFLLPPGGVLTWTLMGLAHELEDATATKPR